MSKEEWRELYQDAWGAYYSPAHMETVMRRAAATGISPGNMPFLLLWFYGCFGSKRCIRCRAAICGASIARTACRICVRKPIRRFIRVTPPIWFGSTFGSLAHCGGSGVSAAV